MADEAPSTGKPKKMYIVFSPDGPTPPVKVHDSHKVALGTAWMMAKVHPGQSFFVMQQASRPCITPVEQPELVEA